jgi:hypothetical protein
MVLKTSQIHVALQQVVFCSGRSPVACDAAFPVEQERVFQYRRDRTIYKILHKDYIWGGPTEVGAYGIGSTGE